MNGAIVAWQKAAALAPTDYDVRDYLASALVTQGREDEALKIYAEMVHLKPDQATPQLALGIAYMHLNKLDDAFKAFQAAIKADPRSAQAHNNLGVVYERRGLLNEAMASYKKANQLNPELEDAKNNLARFGKLVGTPTSKPVAKPKKKIPKYPYKK